MKIKWPKRPEICVQIIGQIYWTCPDCGHLNRNRLAPGCNRVRCTNGECGTRFMTGMNFYRMGYGGKSRGEPPDSYIYLRDKATDLSEIESDPAEFTGQVFCKGTLGDTWETGKFVNTVGPLFKKRTNRR